MSQIKFFRSTKIILSGLLMFTSCSAITNIVKADIETLNASNISSKKKMAGSSKTLSSVIDSQNITSTSSAVSKRTTLVSYCWGGLTLTIDDSGVLHIPGGSVTNPTSIATAIGVSASSIRDISIEGDLVLSGSSLNIFANFPLLEQIDNLTNLNTSNLTSLKSFFANCPFLKSLDLSSFDTTKVKNMDSMFYGDTSLINLDLSNFNTASLTSMTMMFGLASNLTDINLTSFKTSKVISMVSVFHGCTNLQALDISNFSTQSVIAMVNMFNSCTNLNSLTLGSQFQFKGDTALPEIATSDMYTGKWQAVGTGDVQNPEGTIVKSTSELVSSYNGTTDSDTYVWQRFAIPVEVYYQDENGNPIPGVDNDLIQGINGDLVSTNTYQRDIPTYTLDTEKLPISQLKLSANFQNPIVFIYSKNQGMVRIKFQDSEGKQISDDQLITGDEGSSYDTKGKILTIPGYYLDEQNIPNDSKGVFTIGEQTVTYVYKKDMSDIKVHDSTIYVRSIWKAEDNFESANDRKGNKVDISSISIDQSRINTKQVGKYEIFYKLGNLTVTATVTVVENGKVTLPPSAGNKEKPNALPPADTSTPKQGINIHKEENFKEKGNINNISKLPQTGEIKQTIVIVIGALIFGGIFIIFFLKKQLKK